MNSHLSTGHARLLATAIALSLLLLAPGCGKKERDADAAVRSKTFLMVVGADPQSLDPHLATGFVEYQVFLALFEGLTRFDPKSTAPNPGIANRWEVSPNGLIYTFYLRPGAKWSNSDPVTAQDFAFSIQRILTPALGAQYAYFLYDLKGAREFHAGTHTDFSDVGVVVIDEHTIEFSLVRPTPYFPALLYHQAWMPVHRASIEAEGAMDDRSSRWARPGKLVGNGPFKLIEWRNNERIVTERNPHYYGAADVKLNAVHFLPMENTDTGDRAFRAGQVHVTDSLPPARIALYREEHNPDFRSNAYLGTNYITFNTTRPPLNDARIRRAISLATDRQTLVDRVTRGGQIPAGSFTPPGTGGYVPPMNPIFDPEEARILLAAAGFTEGKDFPVIEISFPSGNNAQMVMEALQEMWRRELGINVRLNNVEWKVFLDNLTQMNYEIGMMSWVGDYVDPTTFLTTMLGSSGNNRTGWKNPQFDALIDRAADMPERGARFLRLGEAERVLLDDLPIVPMWHLTRSHLIHPAVRGYSANLLDLHPYQNIWLDDEER